MTTTFLDNKSALSNVIVMAFPSKTMFWDNCPLCPQCRRPPPPPKKKKFQSLFFIVVSSSLTVDANCFVQVGGLLGGCLLSPSSAEH